MLPNGIERISSTFRATPLLFVGGTYESAALALVHRVFGVGRWRFTMARVIQFYVPQNFKPPKKHWLPVRQRGKIIEFHNTAVRKSA